MFRVFVDDIEFYAYHGATDEEQVVGHRYLASVDLSVDGDATQTDDLAGTVDYGAVADIIQRVAAANRFHTLERLGGEVVGEILDRCPLVQRVTLKVSKRLPPIPVIAREAGVEISRDRKQS